MLRSTHTAITAAVLGLAGCLTGVGSAAAIPMMPLAPPCTWQLPHLLTIHQDNNLDVLVTIEDGYARHGQYTAATPTGGMISGSGGTVNFDGSAFMFVMRWHDTGGQNNYSGRIADDGSISGTTLNERDVTNSWTASPNATCTAAPAPASAPPEKPIKHTPRGGSEAQGQQSTATVTEDVDVYQAVDPNTGGVTKLGILRSGNKVQLLGSCSKQDWCNVSGDAVPSGSGWVWGALDF